MYLYVSEIFPTEIRSIGMGFSLFGQFACKYHLSPKKRYFQTNLTTPSHPHPPPDSSYGLQRCRLEVLPRDHLLVRLFHSRYVFTFLLCQNGNSSLTSNSHLLLLPRNSSSDLGRDRQELW